MAPVKQHPRALLSPTRFCRQVRRPTLLRAWRRLRILSRVPEAAAVPQWAAVAVAALVVPAVLAWAAVLVPAVQGVRPWALSLGSTR